MSLGAVITTTNPLNTAREIGKQEADSKPVPARRRRSDLHLYGPDVPHIRLGGVRDGDAGVGIDDHRPVKIRDG